MQYQPITSCSSGSFQCPVTAQLSSSNLLSSAVISVTPALARHFLTDHQRPNRKQSKAVVAKYARQLQKGVFVLTHQGLAFNEIGRMIDGYHRCEAIRQTGITAKFVISTGWPEDNYKVIDTGRRRLASQFLGDSFGPMKSVATNYLQYAAGDRQSLWDTRQQDITVASKVYEEWPEIDEWAESAQACYNDSKIAAGAHLAVLCQASRTENRHLIEPWVTSLTEPSCSAALSGPSLLLRNQFTALSQKKRMGTASARNRSDAYCKIVKAWNAYAQGDTLLRLKWGEKEQVPSVTGFTLRPTAV